MKKKYRPLSFLLIWFLVSCTTTETLNEVTLPPEQTQQAQIAPQQTAPEPVIAPAITQEPEPVIPPAVVQAPEPATPPAITQAPEPATPPVVIQAPEPVTPPTVTQMPEPVTHPAITQTPEPVTPPAITQTPEPVTAQSAPAQQIAPQQTTAQQAPPQQSAPAPVTPPAVAQAPAPAVPAPARTVTSTAARGQAEAALAMGIAAEGEGAEAEALSYYYHAAALDPSQYEAVSRASALAASIASGIIGGDTSNDDQWRMNWTARLAETEKFVYQMINSEDPPFTLFYSTGMDLSVPMNMRADKTWINSVQEAVQVIYGGLNATGRKNDWGLANWPRQGVSGEGSITSQDRFSRNVVFELLNEDNRIIGTQTVNLRPVFHFSRTRNDRIIINYNENNFDTVIFDTVRSNDVSGNMTVRAVPEGAGLRITSLSEQLWLLGLLRIDNGVVRGFDRTLSGIQIHRNQVLDLSGDIWGEPNGITSIGDWAFSGNYLTGVIIPDTVTSIGNGAFARNQLTSVSFGNNIKSIGDRAFYSNRLVSVNIPGSVTSIGNGAFENNLLRSANIPDSITYIGDWAFSRNQLTSADIPGSVTFMGSWAFSRNQLSSVNIPDGITTLNDGVFYDNQLRSITIPESVTSIGLVAFRNNQITEAAIGADTGITVNSFDNRLADFYNSQGRSAGTYNWENRRWHVR